MVKIKFKKLFREADSRFILSCGIKVCAIYSFILLLILYVIWVMLSINNIFFEANGVLTNIELKEAFFDHVFSTVNNKYYYFIIYYIFLFFSGVYIGKILLRPFKMIGVYCLAKSEGENVNYNPNMFTDYKLLTRFSELFFDFLDQTQKLGELQSKDIPAQFSKIKKPIFEKVFFFHFILFICIIALGTSIVSYMITSEIQSQIMDFSMKTLSNGKPSINYFLGNQRHIFDSINNVAISLIFLSFIGLSFNLYQKVNAAIFGFFLTMRSFMKGNYSARVHLIGFAHIRPHGRALNKYLDSIERDFSKSKNKVSSINRKNKKKMT